MSEIASRVKAIIADKLNVDENEVTEKIGRASCRERV